jgi:hypothetical protein
MIEDIIKAVAIFRISADRTEEDIYQELVNEGVEAQRAARLVEFLPLVYCRLVLRNSGARFSNTFQRKQASGTFKELPLSSDPVWSEAMAFAHAEAQNGISARDLLAVAARSAEFDAANQLLNKGSKLENITFAAPILSWPETGP